MRSRFVLIILLFAFFRVGVVFSQIPELSPLSKISLLTVGTGTELSSSFGHTAFRIQDPSLNIDVVFGYGGFDFNAPFFYWKFTTGKLNYSMTGHRYDRFMASYKIERRWVREQVLNLSIDQRNELFRFLNNNYREENRYYKYDFLFDNCATKVPEVFKGVFGEKVTFDLQHVKKEATFRQLIHETLNTNSWAAFGIDLALGSVIDRDATAWEHQFLPLYVMDQFEHTTINGKPLASKAELVFDPKPVSTQTNFFLSPLFWLLLFLIVVVVRTYLDHQRGTRSHWLDFTLFFLTGLAGLIICFLWFATDHSSTKVNFNFLWAFPINLVLAFLIDKRKNPPVWVKKYLWLLLSFLGVTGVLWLLKIQIFSPLVIFILVALMIRYLFLSYHFSAPKSEPSSNPTNNR